MGFWLDFFIYMVCYLFFFKSGHKNAHFFPGYGAHAKILPTSVPTLRPANVNRHNTVVGRHTGNSFYLWGFASSAISDLGSGT